MSNFLHLTFIFLQPGVHLKPFLRLLFFPGSGFCFLDQLLQSVDFVLLPQLLLYRLIFLLQQGF